MVAGINEASEGLLKSAKRVVVKIGSALLVDPDTGLRSDWLRGLAADAAMLSRRGAELIIVSSGSIALGRGALGLRSGALRLEEAQAAAAVGQIALARAYAEALADVGMRAAQVLLTLADTQERRRYLNGCATLSALMRLKATPIVNENDTVATDEIRYGDNDRLAARVALMANADVLVLLSDVDGLYTANPRETPSARRLDVVREVSPEIEAMASGVGTAGAKGGMVTKLMAAKTAMSGGCAMAIARGVPEHADANRPISALLNGGPATWFLPSLSPQAARKQWIAGMKPLGALLIDPGAEAALHQGNSLLPAGLRAAEGNFERGDPVAILREGDRAQIGQALVGYSTEQARAIAGRRSDEVESILGFPPRTALAHRDDIAFLATAADDAPEEMKTREDAG